jgi:hypothetical protein
MLLTSSFPNHKYEASKCNIAEAVVWYGKMCNDLAGELVDTSPDSDTHIGCNFVMAIN